MRSLRHVAVFGMLGGLVLTGYHYVQCATASVASTADDGAPGEGGVSALFRRNLSALGGGYSLSSLKNLHRTDYYIREQYVDPERIDYPGMFKAALGEVEREVPEVVLRLDEENAHLKVQVGNFATDLTLAKLDSFEAMEGELKRVAAILEEHLDQKEVKLPDIEYAFINGMLATLDPHSVFLPPVSATKMEEDNEGEFGGLGITIQSIEGQLTVEYPLEDTPAFKVGIRAGDKIVKIDGEGTLNMDLSDAVDKMRGAPGSSVTITIDREEFASPRDFTIVREMIKPSRVWSRLLDGNVGYVRIDSYHAQVESQLEEELAALGRQAGPSGLRGIVIDMRDNPGGYLHQAVEVADTFLSAGDIVSTVERNGRNRDTKAAKESTTDVTVPLAVLMSGNSASAAEIVAGALKNDERAVIIGERSFGKGSVQNLYPFSGTNEEDSKLKLTVARYLTPGDHSIQNIGIPADIQLDRSVVYPPKKIKDLEKTGAADAESGPRVSLFYRDRVVREADLAGHLVNEDNPQPPLYTVRYLAPDPDGDDSPKTDRKDVTKDFEVLFARDVLVSAHGARRADILKDAASVVAARSKAESAKIEAAFKGLGIDWSACANPDTANVRWDMKLSDGTLHAGELDTIALSVTNLGDKPLCQIAARSKSGNDNLDNIEYYFGRIDPGQTRTYATKTRLAEAYPSEQSAIDLELIDPSRKVLAKSHLSASTTGPALPRYAWSYRFDDTAGGDGDGTIEVGETITMHVDVLNVGEGKGGEVEFDLKKDATLGKSVELVAGKGSFTVPDLAPQARGSGELQFKVVSAPPDNAVPMELRVHESKLYDYASIVKAGFVSYYTQEEKLALTVGQVPPAARREPPAITISRSPGLTTTDPQITISGVATDDVGIRDVIVYHGNKKIAYAGGGDGTPLTSVPFTASSDLDEGNNLLVVLVRDTTGLTTTRAVDVYRPPVETAASVAPTAAPTKTR